MNNKIELIREEICEEGTVEIVGKNTIRVELEWWEREGYGCVESNYDWKNELFMDLEDLCEEKSWGFKEIEIPESGSYGDVTGTLCAVITL